MKKKIAGLVLAATLVTGMGGFGTYSYFSHEDTLKGDISITMGKLDTETKWNGNWQKKSNERTIDENGVVIGEEATLDEVDEACFDANSFNKVKPGDVFERKATIKNTGNLNAVIEAIEVSNKHFGELEITVENKDSMIGDVIKADSLLPYCKQKEITVRIKVRNIGNEKMNETFNLKCEDMIKVKTVQEKIPA